jgi:hypothetical protein
VLPWASPKGRYSRPVAKGVRLGAERLTDQSVCTIVKAYAEGIGLGQPTSALRAGFLSSVARRCASMLKMRDVSRHKSMDVLQADVRDANLFRDHAGAGLLWLVAHKRRRKSGRAGRNRPLVI